MSSEAVTAPAQSARVPAPIAWLRRVPLRRWEWAALVLLCIGAAIGYAHYPTYPNYDSMYSLLWAREIVHGHLPGFDAYRAPTEHPIWLAFSVILLPLGENADRVLLACVVASFVASVAGIYALGKAVFNPLVGAAAAILLLTRLDFPYLAARGYLDITYLALVIWAAVLIVQKPDKRWPVWTLLTCAGLLRPEAWVLLGCYWLWLAWKADWPTRIKLAVLAAIAPVVWTLTDLIVTGDPMYSLNYTTRSASLLGRRQKWYELPKVTWDYMSGLTKWPVLAAGLLGMVLAFWMARKRSAESRRVIAVPAILLISGVATFLAVSLRGFSVINRYLVPGALALMVFAAFALGGYQWLERGTLGRKLWAAGSLALVLMAGAFSAMHFNTRYIDKELKQRQNIRQQMAAVLANPQVKQGLKCGPLSVPNHKLIPDLRWLMHAPESGVVARSGLKDYGMGLKGVSIYLKGTLTFLKHPAYGPFDAKIDSPLIQVPGPAMGLVPSAATKNFSVYVNC